MARLTYIRYTGIKLFINRFVHFKVNHLPGLSTLMTMSACGAPTVYSGHRDNNVVYHSDEKTSCFQLICSPPTCIR